MLSRVFLLLALLGTAQATTPPPLTPTSISFVDKDTPSDVVASVPLVPGAVGGPLVEIPIDDVSILDTLTGIVDFPDGTSFMGVIVDIRILSGGELHCPTDCTKGGWTFGDPDWCVRDDHPPFSLYAGGPENVPLLNGPPRGCELVACERLTIRAAVKGKTGPFEVFSAKVIFTPPPPVPLSISFVDKDTPSDVVASVPLVPGVGASPVVEIPIDDVSILDTLTGIVDFPADTPFMGVTVDVRILSNGKLHCPTDCTRGGWTFGDPDWCVRDDHPPFSLYAGGPENVPLLNGPPSGCELVECEKLTIRVVVQGKCGPAEVWSARVILNPPPPVPTELKFLDLHDPAEPVAILPLVKGESPGPAVDCPVDPSIIHRLTAIAFFPGGESEVDTVDFRVVSGGALKCKHLCTKGGFLDGADYCRREYDSLYALYSGNDLNHLSYPPHGCELVKDKHLTFRVVVNSKTCGSEVYSGQCKFVAPPPVPKSLKFYNLKYPGNAIKTVHLVPGAHGGPTESFPVHPSALEYLTAVADFPDGDSGVKTVDFRVISGGAIHCPDTADCHLGPWVAGADYCQREFQSLYALYSGNDLYHLWAPPHGCELPGHKELIIRVVVTDHQDHPEVYSAKIFLTN